MNSYALEEKMEKEQINDIVILDTNFIIEHKLDFHEIVKKLQSKVNVYIPNIAIKERIAQKWRETKQRYDEIDAFVYKNADLINGIQINADLETKTCNDEIISQKAYKKLFGEKIIPFNATKEVFDKILERVYKKIPPFINEQGSSDKGFKDTMLWLSIIEYFALSKNDCKITLITSDKGFLKYSSSLQVEFLEKTHQHIEIKDNSFYSEFIIEEPLKNDVDNHLSKRESSVIERQSLRDQISETFDDFCTTSVESYDDNYTYLEKNFNIDEKITIEQSKSILENLENVLNNNIFAQNLNSSIVFGENFKIQDKYFISTKVIEKIIYLYYNVKNYYLDHINAFYTVFMVAINENYEKFSLDFVDEIELPF